MLKMIKINRELVRRNKETLYESEKMLVCGADINEIEKIQTEIKIEKSRIPQNNNNITHTLTLQYMY